MTALNEQLLHILKSWDSSDGMERPGAVTGPTGSSHASSHMALFTASMDALKDGNTKTSSGVIAVGDDGMTLQVREECPPWLAEMEQQNDAGGECVTRLEGTPAWETDVHLLSPKQRITKLELARAALALFTSNAGIYQPILRKTISFLFGLIDELLGENADLKGRGVALLNRRNNLQGCVWSPAENTEVAAVHERMRMMEVRMAKLVEDAAKQRDSLKEEIAACRAREVNLEGLLEHQIELSHANAMQRGITPTTTKKRRDALYVKQLIARAEREKAIDELQEEVRILLEEQKQMSNRIQELLELNGRYAMQSVGLAARLSVLSDYNVSSAIESQRHQNQVFLEKSKVAKHLRDLQVARNVMMAAFVNRHDAIQMFRNTASWTQSGAVDEKIRLRLASIAGMTPTTTPTPPPPPPPRDSVEVVADAGNSEGSSAEAQLDQSPATATAVTNASPADVEPLASDDTNANATGAGTAADSKLLRRFWLPGAGDNPYTPEHLRSVCCVDYLSISPLFAERVIRTILSEWREQTTHKPLDVFTREFIENLMVGLDDNAQMLPSEPVGEERRSAARQNGLRIAYALDAISRSGCCGALTYSFGLVTKGQVSEDLFHMMEFDSLVLLSICHFLDMERSAPYKPKGFIPIVQFACVLFAMYPCYPLARLQQLVETARNDGGNRSESPLLLYYTVLLPERTFPGSASPTVDNAGSLWDTSFAHLFLNCICVDVEESWQLVQDSFYSFSKTCSVATEHQLVYEAFRGVPSEIAHLWLAPLRAALASWDELKDKASVVLENLPRIPVKAAMEYLRKCTLLRHGTHSTPSVCDVSFLEELHQKWCNFCGERRKLNFDRYTRLVKCVDPMRQSVWGSASMPAGGNIFRRADTSNNVTIHTLLELLRREEEEEKEKEKEEEEEEEEEEGAKE